MNGEEMLQVFIFHPYCVELQGYTGLALVLRVVCVVTCCNVTPVWR